MKEMVLTSPYKASPYRYKVEQRYVDICSTTRGKVLDVGCGSGQYRNLFPNSVYIGIDITVSKKVNNMIRADAIQLPLRDGVFDTVFCNAVLEHIKDDDRAVGEMSRVLRSGGKLVVGVPTVFSSLFTLGQHGYHYYTKRHLVGMLQRHGFRIVALIPVGGTLSLLVELLRNLYGGFLTHTVTGNCSKQTVGRRSNFKINELTLAKQINAILLKIIDKIDLPAMPGGLIVVGWKTDRSRSQSENVTEHCTGS